MADKKAEKHLFGTSGKSDFIVNMSEKSAEKLCGVYIIIAMILLTIMAIPYYFTQNIVDYTEETGLVHYFNEKFIYYLCLTNLVIGFFGFIFLLISYEKKLIDFKKQKGLLLIPVILILTVVSCVNAVGGESFSAFYGLLDRSEGFITIIGYWGIFAAGLVIANDKWRLKLSDCLVGLGVFQAVTGILQSIPATAKIVPNYFENLYLHFANVPADTSKGEFLISDTMQDIGVYEKGYIASGFLCSPHALAAVLSVIFAIAVIGSIFDKSKGRRIFYIISALLMAAASFCTCTITGVIGIAAACLFTLIIAVVKSVSDKQIAKSTMIKSITALVLTAVIAAGLFLTSAVTFKDEKIIFTDSHVRLSISSTTFVQSYVKDNTNNKIYFDLWDDGIYLTSQHPVFGMGPENSKGMSVYGSYLDRCYNEYIDLLQSRGIICFAAVMIFFIISIVKMVKIIKGFANGENSWLAAAVSVGAAAYMVQALFNISTVTSSPYLWLALGLVWSFTTVKKSSE